MMIKSTVLCKRLSTLALKTEKEWVFNMPWGKTEALSWGNPSDPPVLLCHGRLDACSSFRPLVRHLPPGRFYLSVELPGNGRSTHYPHGGRLLVTDYLPPLERVIDHFKWDKFTFIGHSMGVVLGKFFNSMFPGQITRMVDIEPLPAYLPTSNDLHSWYQYNYSTFHGDDKYTAPALETAPKYSYEEARSRLMKTRGLTEEAADHVLERCLQRTEDGLYRFTLDQRFKSILLLPYLFDSLRDFYTAPKTPTLGIFATQCIASGIYDSFPFAMDDALWKHGNYRHVVMEGNHDIHLQKPEEVGRCITQFLNENPE